MGGPGAQGPAGRGRLGQCADKSRGEGAWALSEPWGAQAGPLQGCEATGEWQGAPCALWRGFLGQEPLRAPGKGGRSGSHQAGGCRLRGLIGCWVVVRLWKGHWGNFNIYMIYRVAETLSSLRSRVQVESGKIN